jgi:hypothetical protein
MMHKLTRRRALRAGAALAAAAAVPALSALAAAPDVTGSIIEPNVAEPDPFDSPGWRPMKAELLAYTLREGGLSSEQASFATLAAMFGAQLFSDEQVATLIEGWPAPRELTWEEANGHLVAAARRRLRPFAEVTPQRLGAGLIVGDAYVRQLPPDVFARAYVRSLPLLREYGLEAA